MSRHAFMGRGLLRPPSAIHRPSRGTGLNSPGMASEAKVPSTRSPDRISTSCPFIMSMATAVNGILRSSNRTSPNMRRSCFLMCRPVMIPDRGQFISKKRRKTRHQFTWRKKSSASSSLSAARAAPMTDPELDPATHAISIPCFRRARMTPKCAMPRTPPEPSARPTFALFVICSSMVRTGM